MLRTARFGAERAARLFCLRCSAAAKRPLEGSMRLAARPLLRDARRSQNSALLNLITFCISRSDVSPGA